MSSTGAYVNTRNITSFSSILSELTKLESRLPSSKLDQFLVFNKAYLLITKSLMQASEKDYFYNPKFVEDFTVCFAAHYFQAINDTVIGSNKLPTAWAILNKTAKYKSTPNFIYLLMGANAHINNDLPITMLKMIDKKKADELLKDVLKVDRVLMKSGREIIHSFKEDRRSLDFLKRNFVFIYYRPVMYMILYWRIKAWGSYMSIRKQSPIGNNYEKKSIHIANRFSKLAKYLN